MRNPGLDFVPDPDANSCHPRDQNDQAGQHEAPRQGGLSEGSLKWHRHTFSPYKQFTGFIIVDSASFFE
jgi:hypothetical protein